MGKTTFTNRVRPELDQLEERSLLAVSVLQQGKTLTITADSAASVRVREKHDQILVEENQGGVVVVLQRVDKDDINRIVFNGSDQNDIFRVKLDDDDLKVVAFGNGGDDQLRANEDSRVEFHGGDGNDFLQSQDDHSSLFGDAGVNTFEAGEDTKVFSNPGDIVNRDD